MTAGEKIEQWVADRVLAGMARAFQQVGIPLNGELTEEPQKEISPIAPPQLPPHEPDEVLAVTTAEYRRESAPPHVHVPDPPEDANRSRPLGERCYEILANAAKGIRVAQMAKILNEDKTAIREALLLDSRVEVFGMGHWRVKGNGDPATEKPAHEKPTEDETRQHTKAEKYSELRIKLAETIAREGPMGSNELAQIVGSNGQLCREAMYEYRWFQLQGGKWHLTDEARPFTDAANKSEDD